MEKCDNENQKEMSLKLLVMKKRNLKDNLRHYFNRWKNNTIRLNDKDHKNEIFAALFKNIMKMSELIVNSKEGINQIKEIQFGILNSSEIAKLSTIECVNQYLYDDDKVPIPYGSLRL